MTRDVNPGRDPYRAALDLVEQGRVWWRPRAAGFHVVPTDRDPLPLPSQLVLWELLVSGLIVPVPPADVAGYAQARPVQLTDRGHTRLHQGPGSSNTTVGESG